MTFESTLRSITATGLPAHPAFSLLLILPVEHVSDPSTLAAIVAAAAGLGGAWLKSRGDKVKREDGLAHQLSQAQQTALDSEREAFQEERAGWRLERAELVNSRHECERELHKVRAELLDALSKNIALQRVHDQIDERKNHGRAR